MQEWVVCVGVLAVAAGCVVDLDYGQTRFLCDTMECPNGFDCQAGVCLAGAALDDAGTAADAAAAADASIDAAPLVCPIDCSPVTGARLCYCDERVSWEQARDACATAGLALARVADAATAQAVRDEAMARGGPAVIRMWLGGTDAALEGQWRWITNDELFWVGLADGAPPAGAFADFNVGEPNQFQGNDEDCLQGWDVGWNDARCTETRPRLCGDP